MHKKLITACMALAAFMALAVVPSIALAVNSPELREGTTNGVKAPPGTTILATNLGELIMTDSSGGILTRCNKATLTGTLTKNDGANIEGNVTKATFQGTGTKAAGAEDPECTGSFGNVTVTANPATNGLPWCIRSTEGMATDEFQVRGDECSKAEREIRFVLHSTTVGECTYGRAIPTIGTLTTDTPTATDAVVHIAAQKFDKKAGGFFCPGAGYLDFSFTIEKDTLPDETADPMWFH